MGQTRRVASRSGDHSEASSSAFGAISSVARIVGSRNVLAHGYDVVDDEVGWDAITTDLPGLTARVAAMLDELDASETMSPGLIRHVDAV